MNAIPKKTSAADDLVQPVRVLVVDDSAVVRGLLSRWIDDLPGCEIVGSVTNGMLAISAAKRNAAEIVVLDVEMPEMDGLTALPQLLEDNPGIKVVMISGLNERNAENSVRALAMGAVEFVAKPSNGERMTSAAGFQRDFIAKIDAISQSLRSRTSFAPAQSRPEAATEKDQNAAHLVAVGNPKHRSRPNGRINPFDLIGIGSSTGGPQALLKFFSAFTGPIDVPVLISQHMPPSFTTILADQLDRSTAYRCIEAQEGMMPEPGVIYVAPGDYHLLVDKRGNNLVLRTRQTPAENFCRPAVDPMFRSMAEHLGDRACGVVLTGMGQDGLNGARALKAANGQVFVQDEQSSVVWGMPGAIARENLADSQATPEELGQRLFAALTGERRAH
ncbi:MAG: chemotaxis-specific protein-glutamate methyltransferase CheB [Pseudomonadota bacterium]